MHLLTNTDWGPGTVPTRFLSCRQSVPIRERQSTVGDRGVVEYLQSEVSSITQILSMENSTFSLFKRLLSELKAERYLVEMKAFDNRVIPSLQLLPTINPHVGQSVCTLSVAGGNPRLDLNPTLRSLVDGGFVLAVRVNSNAVAKPITKRTYDSVPAELALAQRCAIDYAIVEKLQNDMPGHQLGSEWVKTAISKHAGNFSVTFARLGRDAHAVEITVGMFPETLTADAESVAVSRELRQWFLEWCSTAHREFNLIDRMLQSISTRYLN